jgi:hypothetical protein
VGWGAREVRMWLKELTTEIVSISIRTHVVHAHTDSFAVIERDYEKQLF